MYEKVGTDLQSNGYSFLADFFCIVNCSRKNNIACYFYILLAKVYYRCEKEL